MPERSRVKSIEEIIVPRKVWEGRDPSEIEAAFAQVLNIRGYLVIMSELKYKVGHIIEPGPMGVHFRRKPIDHPFAVIGETTPDDWLEQHKLTAEHLKEKFVPISESEWRDRWHFKFYRLSTD